MTESEIKAELERLNCTEIQVASMTNNPDLASFSFRDKQELYQVKSVLELLRQIDASDDTAPNDSVWYMLQKGMEMQQP